MTSCMRRKTKKKNGVQTDKRANYEEELPDLTGVEEAIAVELEVEMEVEAA